MRYPPRSSIFSISMSLAVGFLLGALAVGVQMPEPQKINVLLSPDPGWIYDGNWTPQPAPNDTTIHFLDLRAESPLNVSLNPSLCTVRTPHREEFCIVWRGWWIGAEFPGEISRENIERIYEEARRLNTDNGRRT